MRNSGEENVSFDRIKCVANNKNESIYTWNDVKILIKKNIDLTSMISFVRGVVDSCCDDGAYYPYSKDIAIKRCVLMYYTNIDICDELDVLYDVIVKTNIVDFVCKHIDTNQYNEILSYIDASIEFNKYINEQDVRKQLNKMDNVIDNLEKTLGDVFSAVGKEDIKNISSFIKDSKIDESKIVESIIKYKEKTNVENKERN